MQCLRASTLIARLVLAWFVATLGIAMASPLVTPQQLQVVCTDMGGLKLIVVHGDQDALSGPAHHTLDCPACLSVAPHTPFRTFRLARPSPRSEAPHPLVAAHPAWATGAPLPPRGPPTA